MLDLICRRSFVAMKSYELPLRVTIRWCSIPLGGGVHRAEMASIFVAGSLVGVSCAELPESQGGVLLCAPSQKRESKRPCVGCWWAIPVRRCLTRPIYRAQSLAASATHVRTLTQALHGPSVRHAPQARSQAPVDGRRRGRDAGSIKYLLLMRKRKK